MKNYALILLLAAATVITSCSKDDDGPGGGGTPSVCPMPLNINISNVTSGDALVTWDSITGAQSYSVRFRSASDTNWTVQYTTTNLILLSSLVPNTFYECQVRTNCSTSPGTNSSSYSISVLFTTQPLIISNTQNLCNKDWKLVSFKLNGAEFISQLDPCDLDDFIRFNVDSTYIEDEGPTKCDPTDPQTLTGTWSWVANETKLVSDGNGLASDTLNVLTNSGTVLKFGYTDQTLGFAIEATYGL